MKQRYLVLYDYGQGGVWAYVLAPSKGDIRRLFPELTIVDEIPAWMNEEHRRRLENNAQDVENPGPGLLTDILSERAT